jgi:pyruvate dehydrogenase E1 component
MRDGMTNRAQSVPPDELRMLSELERKVLWLASWTIHHANHLRESADGLKVGGHQASSASLATIMTALYFRTLRPQDRVAVKPHASPNYHAIQYLLGRQTQEKLANFRGYKGAQSYPSRTKDTDDVDFSTGSVGLGVAQTLFSSLVQDYVRAHSWGLDRPEGRMIALVGDAELDEGNIFEAMLEGWKQGLRNCWWVIDYNRQSLDAVVREGLWERYEHLFKNFGWDVVNTAPCSKRHLANRAASACANGSTPARTNFIRRCCSRVARPGASGCSMKSATRARLQS